MIGHRRPRTLRGKRVKPYSSRGDNTGPMYNLMDVRDLGEDTPMTINFSDGTARQLHEIYHEKLEAAWLLYSVARTVESQDALREALRRSPTRPHEGKYQNPGREQRAPASQSAFINRSKHILTRASLYESLVHGKGYLAWLSRIPPAANERGALGVDSGIGAQRRAARACRPPEQIWPAASSMIRSHLQCRCIRARLLDGTAVIASNRLWRRLAPLSEW